VALLGGLVLVGMAFVTVYSVIGRALERNLPDLALLAWWSPIRGDFELIELGTAVAITAFLPYTQMVRGNVLVDFFTAKAGPRAKAALATFANLVYAAVALLFTWRMAVGTHELYTATYTQTSMLLRVPLWWGHLVTTLFFALLSVVCLFTVLRSAAEAAGEGEPVRA